MPGGGPHPKDVELFSELVMPMLRTAAAELRFLRERGYGAEQAVELVGNRHQLRDRQRQALLRATSSAEGLSARAAARAGAGPAPGGLWIDGLNVVITVETALRGGVLVTTVDGGLRDLAGVHGTYRPDDTTDEALRRVAGVLAGRGWERVPTTWYLDAPVSNTGRLAARLRDVAADRGLPWSSEVVPDADAALALAPEGVVVASGDAPVLDRVAAAGRSWLDLGGDTVRAAVPDAWLVALV